MDQINVFLSIFVFIVLSFSSVLASFSASGEVGFFKSTCPLAESIVKTAVNKSVSANPGIAAGLIRMHFHDCFVTGCDGSVLLQSTPGNPAERDQPANNPTSRGFEAIDEGKAQIEPVYPQTVSCADNLAFGARDSSQKLGHINYDVPSGRRDGRVSIMDQVQGNLPPPSFNAQQLIDNFSRKGLSVDEMVTLSGAHSIGVSHCSSFSYRLYSFNANHPQDPSMDPAFAEVLKTKCPPSTNNGGAGDPRVVLDTATPNRLTSEQTLFESDSTRKMVQRNAKDGRNWADKFAKAMVRLIKTCSVVN